MRTIALDNESAGILSQRLRQQNPAKLMMVQVGGGKPMALDALHITDEAVVMHAPAPTPTEPPRAAAPKVKKGKK